jgi:hypothetical protein
VRQFSNGISRSIPRLQQVLFRKFMPRKKLKVKTHKALKIKSGNVTKIKPSGDLNEVTAHVMRELERNSARQAAAHIVRKPD